MLKPIRISAPDHKVFMVSDLHWRHAKVVASRGFDSVASHDEALVHRWNEVVPPDGVVFHLGDLVFKDPESVAFWTLMRRLTFGTLYLMWGNHPSGQKQAYLELLARSCPESVNEAYPLGMMVDDNPAKTVIFLPAYAEAQINKDRFTLSHYPIVSHRDMARGAYMICGHSHGNLPLTNKDTGRGRRLDVGIESFGRPISVSEIKRHLAGRDIDAHDHHGADSGESS